MKILNKIFICLMFVSCINKNIEINKKRINHQKIELRKVLLYFIDDFISTAKVDIVVSPKFEYYLNEADIDSLFNCEFKLYRIKNSPNDTIADSLIPKIVYDTVLNKNNIDHMKSQYFEFKKNYSRLIDSIVGIKQDKYKNKFSYKKPKDNEVYYVITPPMLSINNKYAIIYARSLFEHKNEIRWDDLYYVFRKRNNNKWEIFGFLRD